MASRMEKCLCSNPNNNTLEVDQCVANSDAFQEALGMFSRAKKEVMYDLSMLNC
jgi:hypothetical protein